MPWLELVVVTGNADTNKLIKISEIAEAEKTRMWDSSTANA